MPADIETLTFEQALAELEGIVKALESGQGALEASVAAYQRGAALRGSHYILAFIPPLFIPFLSYLSLHFFP